MQILVTEIEWEMGKYAFLRGKTGILCRINGRNKAANGDKKYRQNAK